ncbi:MAG: hypothetical protein UV61_C0032G0010 [Candidatus Gottesmanbacteria bacterium GW2011_GWB1_43_11]|uniref:Uncharacterized protein n=1 Tax=Candidatus Gottesmanbacteria bacterium GW2011_GWB1_43_11 TaxID=1618446 RepID=A0A0G1CFT2_9BACT|nr:MAG: hypothetical protein UV17_C0043G0008 [Candidatus Gottesmanbacteria bacterium GW2011_GWA1_42_26]KKS84334.1 MAG: hypothetical protein UV61_C0032G0010 [Candidatus Gottesmanbacteria bacterium GW2011_GWB1_43_11]OGG09252.1 MAG: hypothetical protein A2699_06260 [Candidatus Gottesmanbacteria bacterium RIFCSPHIGHO2_01_FULL_43_15]
MDKAPQPTPLETVLRAKVFILGGVEYRYEDPLDAASAIKAGFTPLGMEYESYRDYPETSSVGGRPTADGMQIEIRKYTPDDKMLAIKGHLNKDYTQLTQVCNFQAGTN